MLAFFTRSLVLPGLAALVLALASSACSPLDVVPVGECGNGFVEAGEDCDGQASCGAPGSSFECRYICTSDGEAGEKSSCPAGFVCGGDGLCRKPTGRLVLTASISNGYDALQLGDLDSDGRTDVLGISESLGLLEAHFLIDGAIAQTTGIDWAERAAEVPVGDFTGDGYADVVAPVSGTVGLILGSYDRSFTPLIETFPASNALADLVDVRLMTPVQRGVVALLDPNDPLTEALGDSVKAVAHLEGGGQRLLVDDAERVFEGGQVGLSDTAALIDLSASSGPTLDTMVLGNFDAVRPGLELIYTVPSSQLIGVVRTRTVGDLPNVLDDPATESPLLPGVAFGRAVQATLPIYDGQNLSRTVPALVTLVESFTGLPEACFVHRALGVGLLDVSCVPWPLGGDVLATIDLSHDADGSLTSRGVPDLVTIDGVYACYAATDFEGAGPKGAPISCSDTRYLTFDSAPKELLIDDVDGDGNTDLAGLFNVAVAVGGGYEAQTEVRLYLGDGEGGHSVTALLLGPDARGLAVGDLDGDQRTDIVVTTDDGLDALGVPRRNLEVLYSADFGAFEPASVRGNLSLPSHKRTLVHDFFGEYGGVSDLVLFGHSEPDDVGPTVYSPIVGSPERLYLTPFSTQATGVPLLGLAANVLEPSDGNPTLAPGALDLVGLEGRWQGNGDVAVVTIRPTLEDELGVHPSIEPAVELSLEGTFVDFLGGFGGPLGDARALPRGLVLPGGAGLDELVVFVPDRCASLSPLECASPGASNASTRIYWSDPASATATVPYLVGPPGVGDAGDYSVKGAVRDAAAFDVDDDGVLDVVFLVERTDGEGPTHEVWIVRRVEGAPLALDGAEIIDVSPGRFHSDDEPFFGQPSSLGVLDIDGDGVAEVLVNGEPAEHTYDTLLVRRAVGDQPSTVSRYPWVRWGATSMKTADLTGDGLADLIVTYAGSSGLTTNSFTQIYVANVESAGSGDL
jgi:hypothetical protein